MTDPTLSQFLQSVEEVKNLPPAHMCGTCGQRFVTKGQKRRHKQECRVTQGNVPDASDDPADWYGRGNHITPAIKARADAEWAALDSEGRLPEGWLWNRNTEWSN